jgi:hypothetical protein
MQLSDASYLEPNSISFLDPSFPFSLPILRLNRTLASYSNATISDKYSDFTHHPSDHTDGSIFGDALGCNIKSLKKCLETVALAVDDHGLVHKLS